MTGLFTPALQLQEFEHHMLKGLKKKYLRMLCCKYYIDYHNKAKELDQMKEKVKELTALTKYPQGLSW